MEAVWLRLTSMCSNLKGIGITRLKVCLQLRRAQQSKRQLPARGGTPGLPPFTVTPMERPQQLKVLMIMINGATRANRWRSKMKARSTMARSNAGSSRWMPKAPRSVRLAQSSCRQLGLPLDRSLSMSCRTINRSSKSMAR
jgi:hypothetical protein